MIKVLIVDDSAFARKVLRETLTEAEGFALTGYARDGLEALEMIATDKPDVVTLDLVMPNLDGIGFLKAVRELPQPPRVVVVSMSGANTALGAEALLEGAVAIVHKPTALPTPRLYDLADELRQRVREAAGVRQAPHPVPHLSPAVPPQLQTSRSVLVIGTSTGGPPALTRLLADLPEGFPIPVGMVLHIPVGFTAALAERLNQVSPLDVVEAREGLIVKAGMAVLAEAGRHMLMERYRDAFRVHLSDEPAHVPHRPSVDMLFASVATEGEQAIGVVLTGMGDDGLAGAQKMRAHGGIVLTEAESSCIVYGMPRCVHEAGLSAAQAPIEGMAALIMRHL